MLHCIIILKLDSTKLFFQRFKQVEITWCQIWTAWWMCEHLPTDVGNFLCGLISPMRGHIILMKDYILLKPTRSLSLDCWAQLIRKQWSAVVCIQSNPRRYKIDKNKSDCPRRRRTWSSLLMAELWTFSEEMLRAVGHRENENTTQIYVNETNSHPWTLQQVSDEFQHWEHLPPQEI